MAIRTALIAAAVAGFASPAWARPGSDVEVDFFAERALITQIGTRTLSCGGGAHLTGRTSPYYVRSQSKCPSGPHDPTSTTVSCHFTDAGCSADVRRTVPPQVLRVSKPTKT